MARTSEYPWLVAMVAYTMLSLWLIAQPLVEEGHASKASADPVVPAVTQVDRPNERATRTVSVTAAARLTGRRAAAGLVAALLLLTVAWLAGEIPHHHVPVYDGVNAPDEPYRYIVAPPNAKKAKGPATSAAVSTGVKNNANAGDLFGSSEEQGPQVTFFIPAGGIGPITGSTVKVTATPQAAGGSANGPFVGNAYVVAVAVGGSPTLTATGTSGAQFQLRAPSGKQPGPTIEWHPPGATAFRPLTTARTGNDIYTSRSRGSERTSWCRRRSRTPARAVVSRSGSSC